MFSTIVYILCGITSAVCAGLLWRAYLNSKNRLLLWSALAFLIFTVNNFFVFLDFFVWPSGDLSMYRAGITLSGVIVLVGGLIWESP